MRKFISRIILFLILMGIVYAITAFGFSRLEQRAKGENNANHLNREGADMYSKEIREEINNKRDYETLFKRKHIINQ